MSIQLLALSVVLRFTAGPGSYAVEVSDDHFAWRRVTANHVTNEVNVVVKVPREGGVRFYRVAGEVKRPTTQSTGAL